MRRPCRLSAFLAAALAASLPAGPTFANTPHGEAFLVNSFTTGSQAAPAVAADGLGRFVVVWESHGQDGSSRAVVGRRFDVNGAALGGEFAINTFTAGDQRSPAVAAGDDGAFVVVWESAGQDASGYAVRGRLFDTAGIPVTAEFAVNQFTSGDQSAPRVAIDDSGDFVVVWQSSGQDGAGQGVRARQFGSNGIPAGGEIALNSYTTSDQDRPDVAVDGAGNFVAVWQSVGSFGGDASLASVQARIYDATGSPISGPEFQLNSYGYDNQVWPAIAADDAGNFLVVWQSDGSDGSDHQGTSIQATYMDLQGTLGDEFQVNDNPTLNQVAPAVAGSGSFAFVTTWEGPPSGGTSLDVEIAAKRLDGGALAEFQVNSYTPEEQRAAAIARTANGDFVVVWESYGPVGGDSSSRGILARLYDGLFRDGFESNDASRWSASVP